MPEVTVQLVQERIQYQCDNCKIGYMGNSKMLPEEYGYFSVCNHCSSAAYLPYKYPRNITREIVTPVEKASYV